MLITDDFVMLNFPKTGTSFARRILKQLYYQRRSNYRKILEKLHLCNPSVIELILPKIDDDYIEKEMFWEDMASNITFVHQENLNTELQEFLLSIGIPQHELNFINSAKKVNVSKKSTTGNYQEKSLLDSSITNQIIERDKLLFKIFPEYLPTI